MIGTVMKGHKALNIKKRGVTPKIKRCNLPINKLSTFYATVVLQKSKQKNSFIYDLFTVLLNSKDAYSLSCSTPSPE